LRGDEVKNVSECGGAIDVGDGAAALDREPLLGTGEYNDR